MSNKALGFVVPPERERMIGYGSFERVMNALEHAVSAATTSLGDKFTAADLYVGSQIGFGMMFGSMEKRPAFESYWQRLTARPAYARARQARRCADAAAGKLILSQPRQGSRISGSPYPHRRAVANIVRQSAKPSGAKTMMVEPCSNQPSSSPLRYVGVAGDDVAARDARRLSSASRQCSRMLATRMAATGTRVTALPPAVERRPHHRALVLAEQALDALERDRIDVPGIAGDVDDLLDPAIVRRVEAVIHARRQPQRDVTAVAVRFDQRRDRRADLRSV